jgi:hypothetical protein
MVAGITYTVRYTEDGDPITENYSSALDALARIRALVAHGIGYGFGIYAEAQILMDQSAIFESLKIVGH